MGEWGGAVRGGQRMKLEALVRLGTGGMLFVLINIIIKATWSDSLRAKILQLIWSNNQMLLKF